LTNETTLASHGEMMKATLTITLGMPPAALFPNARPHYLAKANATKAYRQEAKIAALEAISKQPRSFSRMLPFTKGRTYVTFYIPNKRRDADVWTVQLLKAAWDGLQVERKRRNVRTPAWIGAGLIVDDRGLSHAPVDVLLDKANPRVEIFLELES